MANEGNHGQSRDKSSEIFEKKNRASQSIVYSNFKQSTLKTHD